MTISSTTSKVSFNGSGSTGPFSIPYKFSKNADLAVTKVSTAGVASTLALTTNYTLTGAGATSGGTLTLLVALASGERLIIKRSPVKVQETDYVENASFPAKAHEDALDLLTMVSQDLQEQIDRSVKVEISSTTSPDDLLAELAADVASAAADATTAVAAATTAVASTVTALESRTMFYVGDYGVVGDGTTDDTAAFQGVLDAAALAGGIVFIGDNTVLINSSPKTVDGKPCGVTIAGGVTVQGSGTSIIKVGSAFDLDGVAIMNKSGDTGLDTYADAGIRFEGVKFTDARVYPAWNKDNPPTYGAGLTSANITGSVLRLFGCSRPVLRECEFYDMVVLGVAIGGCMEPVVENTIFRNCGHINRATYPLWVSSTPSSGSATKRPKITGNIFNTIDYAGLMCGTDVDGAVISWNTFLDCKEAAIHMPNSCTNATVIGNTIDGVKLGDISAHGIEVENLRDSTITGNSIKNCGRAAICVGCGVQNSVISANILMDNGAATTFPLAPSSLAIGINGTAVNDAARVGILLFNSTGDGVVDNLLITGNNITDTVGDQKYAISLNQTAPSRVYDHVSIIGNDLTDGGSLDDIYYGTNALASLPTGIKVQNNISTRIVGPTASPILSAAYQARELGGEAFQRLLGLPCPPTLFVRARNSKDLTNGIPTGWTFARAANASYYDFSGARQTAGSGVLRHEHDPTTGAYKGWRIEHYVAQKLVNPTSPATQDVSLTAATYCLWVEGTGSCTVSGGPTGTATAGSPITFTLGSTTTVTFTVTGSLTFFQCEAGTIPTSAILAAGVRQADLLYIPVAAFDFNPLEGTLIVEWMVDAVGSTNRYIAALDDGTTNEIMTIALHDAVANDPIYTQITDGGVSQATMTKTLTTVAGLTHVSVFSYKVNAGATTTDGLVPATDTAMTIPTVTNLTVGSRGAALLPLNGCVSMVAYFPRAIHGLSSTGFRDMTRV